MTETAAMDVRLPPRREPRSKWERERNAFLDLLPSLLATHRGKYITVHDGAVAAVGDDPVAVAMGAYARHGYVPIHVGLVTDRPPEPIRLPSPRQLRRVSRVTSTGPT